MKIGNIELGERPVFLAPMEDVTDIGFRMLCKRFGAAMVYTEFVSAEALVREIYGEETHHQRRRTTRGHSDLRS